MCLRRIFPLPCIAKSSISMRCIYNQIEIIIIIKLLYIYIIINLNIIERKNTNMQYQDIGPRLAREYTEKYIATQCNVSWQLLWLRMAGVMSCATICEVPAEAPNNKGGSPGTLGRPTEHDHACCLCRTEKMSRLPPPRQPLPLPPWARADAPSPPAVRARSS